MATIAQCLYHLGRCKKAPSSRTFKLRKNPHRMGIVKRVFIMAPKKPNSGKRKVAKINIKHMREETRLTARVLGYDFHPRKFAHTLARGGRGNDTPGVTYSCIRGHGDHTPHYGKTHRRSFYGLKRIDVPG